MNKLARLVACLMCVCMLMSACASTGTDTGEVTATDTPTETAAATAAPDNGVTQSTKDTLVIAVKQDMVDRDPAGNTTNATVKIKAQVYETLIERTTDNQFLPLLAESWEWSEDYLTLTVKIKEGIKTHNGEELKASDCLFSLGILRNGANSIVTDKIDLEKSHVIDDYTFAIVMQEVYMPVIANLSYPTCAMFSQKGYEENGGDWSKMDIGTGAYMWGEWVQGDHVDLTAFPEYHVEGQPMIQNVQFRVIAEDGNRYIEVETGGADMAYEISGVDIATAEGNSNITVFREYTNDNAYLSFNQRKAPFNDIRVRQAIAHCLDLEGAWKVAMNGIGRPAIGLLPDNVKDSIAGQIQYPMYEYNIEKAKQLLAEAGYPNGFSCQYHAGNLAVRLAYAEYFANALKQAGINVEIVSLDGATNAQALKVEQTFDIYTWGIAATNGDIDFANRFFWSKDSSQRNIMGYSNPQMDELIEAAAREGDPAKRSELNAQIQTLALEDVAIIPIYQQEDVHAHVSNLQGFRNGAYQSPLLKYCYFN